MNVKKKQNFIKKQEYPGGTVAMRKYFSENLKYPEIAIKNRVEGKVLVAYTVDFDGHVSDAKILKGISTECDAEAIRLVKGLKFSAQNNHGIRITSSHKIKVTFKLPAIQIPKTQTTLKYNIVSKNNKVEEKKITKQNNTYNYTIKIGK